MFRFFGLTQKEALTYNSDKDVGMYRFTVKKSPVFWFVLTKRFIYFSNFLLICADEYLDCELSYAIKWDLLKKLSEKCSSIPEYSQNLLDSIMKQISNSDTKVAETALQVCDL